MKILRYLVATAITAGVALVLIGCATPQEWAITAYCQAEGLLALPPQTATQQVMRSFWMGDRVVGFRNRCHTVTSDGKDAKGNPVVIKKLCALMTPFTSRFTKTDG